MFFASPLRSMENCISLLDDLQLRLMPKRSRSRHSSRSRRRHRRRSRSQSPSPSSGRPGPRPNGRLHRPNNCRPTTSRSTRMAPFSPSTHAMRDRDRSDDVRDAAESLISIVRHLCVAQQQTSSDLAAERGLRQRLEVRVRDLEDSRLCVICLDRPRQVALQPCSHLVACETCSPRLTRCPICQEVFHGQFSVRVP